MDVQECNLVVIKRLPEGEEAGQYSSRNKEDPYFFLSLELAPLPCGEF